MHSVGTTIFIVLALIAGMIGIPHLPYILIGGAVAHAVLHLSDTIKNHQ